MRELRHLILHRLVYAFVRAMCRCSMQLCLIKLDKRAAEAAPIRGIPVEPI